MKNKHIKLFIIIYCVILVVGTVFYFIVPKGNFSKVNVNNRNSNTNYSNSDPKVAIQGLKNNNLIEEYKIGSYNFDKDTLEISSDMKEEQILLERKGTNDNKIEVYRVIGAEMLWRNELSKKVSSPKIELADYKLIITGEKQKFDYIQFYKDATITQFKQSEKISDNLVHSEYITPIIYVKVPKDQKVVVDGYFQYVNE